jgi:hypothetical protein
VLDLIEHSPTGAVPRTPAYDEAIAHLRATQQVYASADHKDGHVTARSLARLPLFHAANLPEFIAGSLDAAALEPNHAIFDRYLQSLPPLQRSRAEGFREKVSGRPIHHRQKFVPGQPADLLNTLFLVPGAGPQPGLPGNYLHGALTEFHDAKHPRPWCLHLCDSSNDSALLDLASLPEALAKLQEVLDSAPFHLSELEALGFRLD